MTLTPPYTHTPPTRVNNNYPPPQALAQAAAGRYHILSQMEACSPPPSRSLSKWAPRVVQINIPADKLGALIGPVGVRAGLGLGLCLSTHSAAASSL